MHSNKPIHILGGGFSGLAQAFYLVERGIPVVVHEKDQRLGGLLGSQRRDGFLIEQAANAFMNNPAVEEIANRIGVRLLPVKKSAKKRFIYRDKKMRRWPLSLAESLPVLGTVLKGALSKKSLHAQQGDTLQQWGSRNLGKAASEFLLEPAMQGIYANSLDQLDAESILTSMMTKFPAGKVRGSVAPAGGMQDWIDKLSNYLRDKNCEFVIGSDLASITNPTIFAVGLQDLKDLARKGLIDVPCEIAQTATCSLSSVTLYFAEERPFTEGFGCLFPNSENFNSKGVLFNHNIFYNRCTTGSSETWILNDHGQNFSQMAPATVLSAVLADRQRLTWKTVRPTDHAVFQWNRRIPVYNAALANFNRALEQSTQKNLYVGNYLGHLGLGKILWRAQDNANKVVGGFFG